MSNNNVAMVKYHLKTQVMSAEDWKMKASDEFPPAKQTQ